LDAAKLAHLEFLLGGEVAPYSFHEEYFRNEIVPRLDKQRRLVGKLGFESKKRLMQEARCVLVPSTVQETSSLVAMESLAAGTPVIAFPSGALPEIIEDGVTGYLVTNTREMARAIAAVDKLDPEACRREARRRFSASKMAERYLEVYAQIISQASAPKPARTLSATSWLVNW
jgi:glycosyltransferase involved in cell wall biosynthesis